MSELSEYTVVLNGMDHTVLLSKEDAERMGAKAKAAAAENKARTTTQNKAK